MKTCQYCGSIYSGNEKFCGLCGAPLCEEPVPNSSLCVLSIVFAISGCLMLIPVVSPLIGLLTGRAALKQGKDKTAAAGVILSVVSLSYSVLFASLLILSFIF